MPIDQQVPNLPGLNLQQEKTRRYITYWALGTYVFLLAFIVIVGWMFLKFPVEEVLKVLTTIAGVLGGVVGAIIAFYFTTKEQVS